MTASSQKLHDKIRHVIETTPGLTQRGLAERMGLNPAAVNRMLYGRRNIMAEEIPLIESYLGVCLDVGGRASVANDMPVQATHKTRGFSDVQEVPLYDDGVSSLPLVPVLQGLRGSSVIDWVPRHPLQAGIREAYALYVSGDDMAPRYYAGELVYIHPGKPAEQNRDCVFEMKDGSYKIRRLMASTASEYNVRSFTPTQIKALPRKDVAAVYVIVGRG